MENTNHFFLQCSYYNEQRTTLLNYVAQYQTVTLKLLLYGDVTLPLDINISIFNNVQKYILDTKRFTSNVLIFYQMCCYRARNAMVLNIVIEQTPESHDAQTPSSASRKANFHFTCCHSVHFHLAILPIFLSKILTSY